MPPSPAAIPLSLYIHIPWCVRKCPYCDFNSHAVRVEPPEREYVDALLADLAQDRPGVQGRPIATVFIGGGTPSLFSPAAIARLLTEIRARLPLAADAEITLEANPGTVEREKFREFRAAGINRLSIGVQSFDDGHLQRLRRIHTRREAFHAAEAAHAAGFDRFNLDLMVGLPGQTPAQAAADIANAIALEPAHLSHYQLTLEPNTLFHRYPPADLPDEDSLWTAQERCREHLARAGYEHYEVSAWARPGARCRHNLNYWEFGDYLGIGAGAHGKLSDGQEGVERRWKLKHPRDYLRYAGTAAGISGRQTLTEGDLAAEFMLNALRLVDGFPASLFAERTGLDLDIIESSLRAAVERGLLQHDGDIIQPTEPGQRFLDDLVGLFLREHADA